MSEINRADSRDRALFTYHIVLHILTGGRLRCPPPPYVSRETSSVTMNSLNEERQQEASFPRIAAVRTM